MANPADQGGQANQNNQKKYKIKVSDEMEAGVYSNAASVQFNNNECIIDFGYAVPNSNEPTIRVVSRVNISHRTAESLLKLMSNAVLDYKNRQKNNSQE